MRYHIYLHQQSGCIWFPLTGITVGKFDTANANCISAVRTLLIVTCLEYFLLAVPQAQTPRTKMNISRQLKLSTVAAIFIAAITPSAALATNTAQVTTQVGISGPPGSQPVGDGALNKKTSATHLPASAQSDLEVYGHGATSLARGYAYAEAGQLKARSGAMISPFNNPFGLVTAGASASSLASSVENVTFTSAQAGAAIQLSGNLQISGFGMSNWVQGLQVTIKSPGFSSFTSNAEYRIICSMSACDSHLYSYNYSLARYEVSNLKSWDGTSALLLPFSFAVGNGQTTEIATSISVLAKVTGTVNDVTEAIGDFSHTVTWGGLTAYDYYAPGNKITDLSAIGQTSGFNYANAFVSGVPEPENWAMLLSGLVIILARRKGISRAQEQL